MCLSRPFEHPLLPPPASTLVPFWLLALCVFWLLPGAFAFSDVIEVVPSFRAWIPTVSSSFHDVLVLSLATMCWSKGRPGYALCLLWLALPGVEALPLAPPGILELFDFLHSDFLGVIILICGLGLVILAVLNSLPGSPARSRTRRLGVEAAIALARQLGNRIWVPVENIRTHLTRPGRAGEIAFLDLIDQPFPLMDQDSRHRLHRARTSPFLVTTRRWRNKQRCYGKLVFDWTRL